MAQTDTNSVSSNTKMCKPKSQLTRDDMAVKPARFRRLDPRPTRHHSGQCCGDTQLFQPVSDTNNNMPVDIREVWRFNLEEEFVNIHWALHHGYGVVALDTEFPGAPYVPCDVSLNYRDRDSKEHYAVIKMNVHGLKIIQVGITLTDQFGNMPHFGTGKRVAWQFNFSDFDPDTDQCSIESVSLLKNHGIDFARHKMFGIDSARFAYFMCRSGLVGPLGCSTTWITFHGGMDLAYLLKMILLKGLPDDLAGFKSHIKYFFGCCVFDIKYMMTYCGLHGGLDKVARTLEVEREAGASHTAGSDSLVTTVVFQRLQELYFGAHEELYKYAGKLYNLCS